MQFNVEIYWGFPFLQMVDSWKESISPVYLHISIIPNAFKVFFLTEVAVQFSCSVMSDYLWPHELQDTRPLCPSPRVHQNPHPLSRRYHPIISPSVIPSSPPPSILTSIRIFSNESALCIRWPKYLSFSFNISPSNEYSGLISFRINWLDLLARRLSSKGLSRVFSNTMVQKHQFFGAQLSSQSNSYIHTWLLEKP